MKVLCESCGKEFKKRTLKQNSSLHKFFQIISDQLNEMGREFTYTGLKGSDLSMRYTPQIVKDCFWRPIQKVLFDKDSTTDLKSKEIDEIADVVIKFFGDKGVVIDFPRKINN